MAETVKDPFAKASDDPRGRILRALTKVASAVRGVADIVAKSELSRNLSDPAVAKACEALDAIQATLQRIGGFVEKHRGGAAGGNPDTQYNLQQVLQPLDSISLSRVLKEQDELLSGKRHNV
jgi:hypothetical protein